MHSEGLGQVWTSAATLLLIVFSLLHSAFAQELAWSVDVGAVGSAGSSTYNTATQTYQINGAGIGLTGSADAFHFAYYQVLRGDGEMVVRLASADVLAAPALVLRASLAADAASAAVVVSGGTAQFARRTVSGGSTTTGTSVSAAPPCWLRVVRSGTTVGAFISADGQTWTSLGSDTIDLGAGAVHAGLAISNGVSSATSTASASFDQLRSTFLPQEGLALWLKADTGLTQDTNGHISAWADQSGGSHDVFQANASQQPSFVAAAALGNNGQPAVRFDGVGQYLQVPDVMNGATAGELFVVLRATDPTHRHSFLNFTTNYVSLSIYPYTDGHIYESFGSTTFYDLGLALTDVTQFHLYNAVSTPGEWTSRLNEQMQFTTTGNTVGFPAAPAIGFSDNYAGTYFAGDIAEILVYRRALSATERSAVEAYLNGKYAYNPPPVAPTDLSVVALSPTQTALFWNESSSSASGYAIERQNADGSWSVIATTASGTTTYIDAGLLPNTAYTYRVTAIGSLGNSAASTAASGTTQTNDGTGTLFPLTGLRLWLHADAGVSANASGLVGRWVDQSGGQLALQSDSSKKPSLLLNASNGRPAIHFNGTSDYLTLPNIMSGATAGELFVVLRATDPTQRHSFLNFGTSPYGISLYPHSDGHIYESFGSTAFYDLGQPLLDVTQFHLYDAVSSPGDWTSRLNEQLQFTTTNNSVGFTSSPNLGSSDGYSGTYFAGDIAEILVYDHSLTATERTKVGTYLNTRYAFSVPPAPPANPSAEVLSSSQANLRWMASPGATGYSLERKVTGTTDAAYVEVAAIAGGTVQSYIDGSLTPGSNYSYRLRADSFAGYSGYSTVCTVVLPTNGVNALATNDLLLWLKPDAGVTKDSDGLISRWADASGHGNDATVLSANRPQWINDSLNGQPVVHFDGSTSYLQLPTGFGDFSQGLTALVLVRPTNRAAWQRILDLASGAGNNEIQLLRNGSGDDLGYYASGPANGLTGVIAPGALSLGQARLLEVVHGTGGVATAYKNGSQVGQAAAVAINNATRTTSFIGKSTYLGDPLYQGDIAEILLFDHDLTATERRGWETYLNSKYHYLSVPTAPVQFVANRLSATQIALSWVDTSESIDTYQVERQNPDGSWSLVATLAAGTSRYVATGLAPGAQYNFRITATNLAGNSTATMVSATTPASSRSSFPVDEMQLWLEADSGAITSTTDKLPCWVDQSGHGHDAQQGAAGAQPTVVAGVLNGRPVVRFDGSSNFLQLPASTVAGLSQGELFVVLRAADPANQPDGSWGFGGGGDGAYYGNGGLIYENFGSDTRHGPILPPAQLDQFNLYNVSAATNDWTVRLNEQMLAHSASNTPTFGGAPVLGRNSEGYGLKGDIAEVLIFDHALSETERLTVEEYLAGKYALTTVPPIPSNLSARAVGPTQVSLSWQYPLTSHATQFTIERAAGGSNQYQTVLFVNGSTSQMDETVLANTTYSYRIVAVDLAGNHSPPSAPVTVHTPISGVAMPVAGLRLWLKADAGTGSGNLPCWVDQSGHGHDAQQGAAGAQPTVVAGVLNGRPVVRFDGSSNFLQLPASTVAGLSQGELFVVLRAADPANQPDGSWGFGGGGDGAYYGNGGLIYENFGSDTRHGPILPPAQLDQFNLYNVSAATNDWTVRLNEQMLAHSASNTPTFGGAPVLGRNSEGYGLKGDIAEVLIFDHVLNGSEHNRISWYLASKYLLANYDLDADGLTNEREAALGTDPFNPDTNGDGISDGISVRLGINPLATGGFNFATPPSPTGGGGGSTPPVDPNDHVPPVITLTAPSNALPLP